MSSYLILGHIVSASDQDCDEILPFQNHVQNITSMVMVGFG